MLYDTYRIFLLYQKQLTKIIARNSDAIIWSLTNPAASPVSLAGWSSLHL